MLWKAPPLLTFGCSLWFSIARAAPVEHLLERKDDCESRGGSLVWVALQMGQLSGSEILEALLVEPMIEKPEEAENHICIPRKCAGSIEISGDQCMNVKGWVISKLLEAHQSTKGGLGFDHVFHSAIHQHPWMFTGVEDDQIPKLPLAFGMPHLKTPALREVPHRPLRIALLSSHAPVAAVLAEHFEDLESQARFVYYGSCYLCEHTSTCLERRQESLADQSCDLFHHPDEVPAGTWLDIAHDVAVRESQASFLICFGLALCHFWFSLLIGTPRVQLLCMNPLQGVPQHLAVVMLLDLRRRVMEAKADDQVPRSDQTLVHGQCKENLWINHHVKPEAASFCCKDSTLQTCPFRNGQLESVKNLNRKYCNRNKMEKWNT